jgi:hypothetical protein
MVRKTRLFDRAARLEGRGRAVSLPIMLSAVLVTASAVLVQGAPVPGGAPTGIPAGGVVVELFHSEGCSSCPPVGDMANRLVAQARKQGMPVYVLGYHVDYFNNLGWKDPFSQPAWTARQTEYVQKLRLPGLATPTMLMNGHLWLSSNVAFQKFGDLLNVELNQPPVARLSLAGIKAVGGKVTADVSVEGQASGLVLHAALVERGLVSQVTAGENKGKTLQHDHTVRALVSQPWPQDGKPKVEIPVPEGVKLANASVVVFLQDPATLRIFLARGADVEAPKPGQAAPGE